MQDKNKKKVQSRYRRARRTRAKMQGSAEKPRLSIFRSLMHISVQAIDDVNGKTIATATDKQLKVKGNKTEVAQKVGELMGNKLNELKVSKAVFDKGSYKYHGRVKALADGIRSAGIKF